MCKKESGPYPATDYRAKSNKNYIDTILGQFDLVKAESEKIFENLSTMFRLHDEARRLVREIIPAGNNYTKCNVCRISADVPIVRNAEHRRAYYNNLVHCSSPMLCPVCSPRISSRRSEEIALSVKSWLSDPAHTVYMITLTASHTLSDTLSDFMQKFLKSREIFWAHRSVKDLLREMGSPLGPLRSFEILWGKNGWHPHFHVLVWGCSGVDLEKISGSLKRLWLRCLRLTGLSGNIQHGLNVIEARSVQDYLTKISLEIGLSMNKTGRSGGLTPFQLLGKSREGDTMAGKRFQELYWYFHENRLHPLRWPNGGKRFFGIGEVSDDDICNSRDDDYKIYFRLAPELWSALRGDAESKATLLSLASVDDRRGFIDFLVHFVKRKGINYVPGTTEKASGRASSDAGRISTCTMCNRPRGRVVGDRYKEYASLLRKAVLPSLRSAVHASGATCRPGRPSPGSVLRR